MYLELVFDQQLLVTSRRRLSRSRRGDAARLLPPPPPPPPTYVEESESMPRGEYAGLGGSFGTVAAGAISISSPADDPVTGREYARGDFGAGGAGPRPGGGGCRVYDDRRTLRRLPRTYVPSNDGVLHF